MSVTSASAETKMKVGLFALFGLLLLGAVTVYVNDRPYWWKKCQVVYINAEDATGLKTKSAIRSLGLEIGYLKSVELSEEHVRLGICVTAPVEILESTRAFIRGEGFLGDKFVELRPVRYQGGLRGAESAKTIEAAPKDPTDKDKIKTNEGAHPIEVQRTSFYFKATTPVAFFFRLVLSNAYAQNKTEGGAQSGREIPVGKDNQDISAVVKKVDGLVTEMTGLTQNLREAIDPKQLKETMIQLNRALEAASKTLSPEGGLNTTAQRTLAKLEESIENLRDIMARINRGEGSVGKLINDPVYADEIHQAIKNVNRLLGRVQDIRFVIDLGGEQIQGYTGGRAFFKLQIYPRRDRYYLVGISLDPRGKRSVKRTTTAVNSVSTTTETTEVEEGGLLFNLMLGKIFLDRFEFALGLLNGDGTATFALRFGPQDREDRFVLRSDTYSRGKGFGVDDRISLIAKPFNEWTALGAVYFRGGLESIHRVDGKLPLFVGAGVSFDDEDIRLLFAFASR